MFKIPSKHTNTITHDKQSEADLERLFEKRPLKPESDIVAELMSVVIPKLKNELKTMVLSEKKTSRSNARQKTKVSKYKM